MLAPNALRFAIKITLFKSMAQTSSEGSQEHHSHLRDFLSLSILTSVFSISNRTKVPAFLFHAEKGILKLS